MYTNFACPAPPAAMGPPGDAYALGTRKASMRLRVRMTIEPVRAVVRSVTPLPAASVALCKSEVKATPVPAVPVLFTGRVKVVATPATAVAGVRVPTVRSGWLGQTFVP